jgi:hypothetical protein
MVQLLAGTVLLLIVAASSRESKHNGRVFVVLTNPFGLTAAVAMTAGHGSAPSGMRSFVSAAWRVCGKRCLCVNKCLNAVDCTHWCVQVALGFEPTVAGQEPTRCTANDRQAPRGPLQAYASTYWFFIAMWLVATASLQNNCFRFGAWLGARGPRDSPVQELLRTGRRFQSS